MANTHTEFASRIRSLGFRMTPQRGAILDVLQESATHMTIGEIVTRVQQVAPEVDRATVYRSIHFFSQIGMVVSADLGSTTVYELARPHPHHHLVCRNCNSVTVVEEQFFNGLADHLRNSVGFEVDINHVTIYGLCRNCQPQ